VPQGLLLLLRSSLFQGLLLPACCTLALQLLLQQQGLTPCQLHRQ
jgi:hypothetical protein